MLYLEPAPYIVGLIQEARELWSGSIDVCYVSPSLTQPWRHEPRDREEAFLPGGTPAALVEIWRRCARRRYDLVHLAGWGHPVLLAALIAAAASRLPVIVESDTQLVLTPVLKRTLKRVFYPPLFRLPAAFLPGGKRQAAYLRHYWVEDDRITIGQMTSDVASIAGYKAQLGSIARMAARRQLGIADKATAILYVGRLEPEKGIPDLLQAYRQLHPACDPVALIIAGAGSLEGMLLDAATRDGSIHYVGHLLGERLWLTYCIADLFVLPSRFEPWGLVVNEAMAAGLPVVVSELAGCVDDLVDERSGVIVPAAAVGELASALRYLVGDRERRLAMAAVARCRIAPWTLRKSAEITISRWREAL